MKKLLQVLDEQLLKIGVGFTFLFIALYPKLPSVHIIRTWVYIRLEDFAIAALVLIWLVQLIRRKVKLPLPVGIPLVVYWVAGLATLVSSLLFVAPHTVGFFPHIAALQYFRRIEYMILFFVAFSTVRSLKDLKYYMVILCITLFSVVLYGLGQRFYLDFWSWFPQFFSKNPFCFPSFQTGNEEFAKGLPLCLPREARITSTFGGHYDLAAFLVVVMPLLLGVYVSVKKMWMKVVVALLFVGSLALLTLTASRVSFFAYLLGAMLALVFLKRKKLLIPLVAISIIMLLAFSGSTAKRFFETFRVVNVVTNKQGQVVGQVASTTESNLPKLPKNLQDKISKTQPDQSNKPSQGVIVEAPPPTQNLPTGSSFITLPQAPVATNVATVKNQLSSRDALRLKLQNGGIEISTISGTFLIKRALVYDISFTTRFQGEWPNAWAAFMSNPVLGKGFSSITLAADNDYLRMLGESGFLGFASFLSIFVILGIFLKDTKSAADPFARNVALGLAGGVVGLFINASLIDVFEASKVAESLWLLLGVAVGGLSLTKGVAVGYRNDIKKILTSHIFLVGYLVILFCVVFGGGLGNFFVADDFTWLKWAATTVPSDLVRNFINAGGFFYQPLDKTIVFFLYSFFAFNPVGYHLFSLLLHLLMVVGIYLLGLTIFKQKVWAWVFACVYMVLPLHAETVFWFASLSIILSSLFLLYTLLFFIWSSKRQSVVLYALSMMSAVLALLSHEMALLVPLLIFITESVLLRRKVSWKTILPFVALDGVYLLVRSKAHVAPVGGDYAYNVARFIPNVIGNTIGYVGLLLTGNNTFFWYTALRVAMRPYAFVLGLLGTLLLLGLGYLLLKRKQNMTLTETNRLGVWGALLLGVALLPFLGLGNIAERYGYFAAVGFALLLILLLRFLLQFVSSVKKKVVIAAVLLSVFFVSSTAILKSELSDWSGAGTITQETLAFLRYQYSGVQSGSNLFFVNVPIKYKNAWVFPVGLPEGLWFIYKDDGQKIYQLKTLNEAKGLSAINPSMLPAKNYIFEFDKNGELNEVH